MAQITGPLDLESGAWPLCPARRHRVAWACPSTSPAPSQPTSSTSFPRTWPCSLTRCASATSASGKVARDREREAPALDQFADLAERVDRAVGGIAAAERHPMLLGSAEVGDC